MGNPRSTDNKLFDIVWLEWPPRINGAGMWEKKKKGPALKKFEKIAPTEEQAYDMVEWIKRDKDCRKKSEDSGKFYAPPPDLVVFLNNRSWEMDEIGEVVTKTQRYEKNRSKSIKDNNLRDGISQWQGTITTWPIPKLRGSKLFMGLVRGCPGFREWALEQRPELKGSKAHVVSDEISTKPVVAIKTDLNRHKMPEAADLPPPKPDAKQLLKEVRIYAKNKGINLY